VCQDRDLAVYIRIQKRVDFVLGVVIGKIFSSTYDLDILCGFTFLHWLRRAKLFIPSKAISISSFLISEFELGLTGRSIFGGMQITALPDDAKFT